LVTNIEENEKTRNTKEWFSCVLKKLRNDTKEPSPCVLLDYAMFFISYGKNRVHRLAGGKGIRILS